MRPHSPGNTRASGLARARMLMKSKLGWLEGYPDHEGWTVVPDEGERGVERLTLDRNHLRRATYTAAKLRGEFPRAMPRLVGDVDAWHEAVSEVLAALKPWVHRDEPPPRELYSAGLFSRTVSGRARTLAREHPSLHPLVDALSWVLATRASRAPKYLAWILREAEALEVVFDKLLPAKALPLALRCAHLAVSLGPKSLRPLMQLLGDPTAYDAPLRGAREYMQQTQAVFNRKGSPGRLPSPPMPRLLESIDTWVHRLLTMERTNAKRFLQLLGWCDLGPLAQAMSQWWPEAIRVASRAHGVRVHMDESRARMIRLGRLRHEHEALNQSVPPELRLAGLTEALTVASGSGFVDCFAPAGRILLRLPGSSRAAIRCGLLMQWVHYRGDDSWGAPRRLPRLLRAYSSYLAAISEDSTIEFLVPWHGNVARIASSGEISYSKIYELLDDEDHQTRDIQCFFEALDSINEDAPSLDGSVLFSVLLATIEVVHDAELAAKLCLALMHHDPSKRWYNIGELRVAFALCEANLESFARLVEALDSINDDIELELDLDTLVGALKSAFGDDLDLLRSLVLDDDRGPLLACGRKLAVLDALEHPLHLDPPTTRPDRAWLQDYPPQLHDALIWLCGITPRAPAIAAKVLRSVRRNRASVEAELRAVEQMLLQATAERRQHLEKRCETLQSRLEQPPPSPSEAKLDRLGVKLRRRGGLAQLERIDRAADEQLTAAVAGSLGLDPATPWLEDERLLMLLVPLWEESKATQKLARAILKRRAAPPPWDLREHPANAAFIESLRARKLDPGPWLDGSGGLDGVGEMTVKHKGQRITLRLEDDPLEIFHMGRHFGTCLSPGHCNFFSVFVNAADINKRVLYARDAQGRVLGRRLLCLTAQGAIVAFNCYAHDSSWDLDKHSTAFVLRLAEAMGTVVVSRGTVPTLVAREWYDDGSVDIAGQFGELEEGSDFRTALDTVPPEGLAALVARTFGRAKVDEILAPMLVALPELAARPVLAASLLPLLRHPARLPTASCVVYARMLAQAGAVDRVRSLFVEPLVNALHRSHREQEWMDPDIVEFLARCAPSRALQLLRKTRGRGVRSWDDEERVERLIAASIAMETLRRPGQALRLCRLAVDASNKNRSHMGRVARRRLKQLEA
ncbi:MAG: hypothetical protein AAGF11_13200 [Myxococcota bacterium]